MSLIEKAKEFFEKLNTIPKAQTPLKRYDQKIQFEIVDDESFYMDVRNGRITVNKGDLGAKRIDLMDITHFQTNRKTLEKIFQGMIRYSDALIPSPHCEDKGEVLVMAENWLFKIPITNWLGQLVRIGQEPVYSDSEF